MAGNLQMRGEHMKRAQLNKWMIAIVALIFLLAGNAWADGKHRPAPQKNDGHQIAMHHGQAPSNGNGYGHPGAYHQGPEQQNPRPHHNFHKPHHRYDRPAATNIRISPDPNRVLLSALFANPALLFDISIGN